MRHLEQTITQLKNEVLEVKNSNNFHKSLMSFITESLDASSSEDISLSIFQALDDLGWKSGLLINSGLRIMEIDPASLLTDREKILINNMQVGEVNSQKNGRQIQFHYMNISGKIVFENASNMNTEQHETTLSLLQAADKIIEKMKSVQLVKQRKKLLQESVNNIKKLAVEVDLTLEKINKRNKDNISNSFGQIQDVAHSKGLSDMQAAYVENLEQQTLNALSADQTLRLKVKKQFLLVLKAMDDY